MIWPAIGPLVIRRTKSAIALTLTGGLPGGKRRLHGSITPIRKPADPPVAALLDQQDGPHPRAGHALVGGGGGLAVDRDLRVDVVDLGLLLRGELPAQLANDRGARTLPGGDDLAPGGGADLTAGLGSVATGGRREERLDGVAGLGGVGLRATAGGEAPQGSDGGQARDGPAGGGSAQHAGQTTNSGDVGGGGRLAPLCRATALDEIGRPSAQREHAEHDQGDVAQAQVAGPLLLAGDVDLRPLRRQRRNERGVL